MLCTLKRIESLLTCLLISMFALGCTKFTSTYSKFEDKGPAIPSIVPPTGLTLVGLAPGGTVSVLRGVSVDYVSNLVSGDSPLSFRITPELPAGFSLDTATGRLTGSSGQVVAKNSFTLTAFNSAGETGFAFFLEVSPGPAPTITSVTPQMVKVNTLTTFTIKGTRFEDGMTVVIGGQACGSIVLISEIELNCQLAPTPEGTKDLTISSIAGTATSTGAIEALGIPRISTITPARGPTGGGNLVRITGSGFGLTPAVSIGNSPCLNRLVVAPNTVTCIAPSSSAGTYAVKVESIGGTGSGPATYTYAPAFNSRWKTDHPGVSNPSQIRLPLVANGIYDFTVYWGDQTYSDIAQFNAPQAVHTYQSPGTYDVAIIGKIEGFQFGLNEAASDSRKIVDISQFGPLQLGNGGGYFGNARNLIISATDPLNLTGTTNLTMMFRNCTSLVEAPSLATWDTSQVTVMESLFWGASKFNQPIGDWNTSKVTSMLLMFYDAASFNQPIGRWNTSQVTTMQSMFSGAAAFDQPIGDWDTSKVTTFERMFNYAVNFNQPIGNWNTSQVRNVWGMFANAFKFNQPIDRWDISKLTNLNELFYRANAFNQPLSNWNTSLITGLVSTFSGALAFNQPLDSWDVSKVVAMSSLFSGAKTFNQPLSNWNTASLKYTYALFGGATSFNQPLNTWQVSSVSDMRHMFRDATAFNQSLASWNIQSLEMAQGFAENSGLSTANYDALLNSWINSSPKSNVPISFGRLKYTSSSSGTARARFTAAPLLWQITDGGAL
jgi:surface protein